MIKSTGHIACPVFLCFNRKKILRRPRRNRDAGTYFSNNREMRFAVRIPEQFCLKKDRAKREKGMVIIMRLTNGTEVTAAVYREQDAEEIVSLIARNFREVNVRDYGAEAMEALAASHDVNWFKGVAAYANVYVFWNEGKIVGVGSISSFWGSPTESILLTVFVLPELHRQGIGNFIIDTLENDELFLRADRIEIPASITAVEFYRKRGYDYKNGKQELDDEQHYRLEKFRRNITLRKAGVEDVELLHKMQVEAFQELLDRYQDYDTNPAGETADKVLLRLEQEFTYFYFICLNDRKVGAIRVVDKKETGRNKRISPLFVLPEFQERGIAQEAVRLCEELHGSKNWELSTILQEEKNCYLYEKMGYRKTGETKAINEKLTLVFYEK